MNKRNLQVENKIECEKSLQHLYGQGWIQWGQEGAVAPPLGTKRVI